MTNIRSISGELSANGAKVAIAVGRFNGFIVESLLDGAIDALERSGVKSSDITVVRAPGAFELPLVADKLAASGNYQAVIVLGAVIRGSTPHFDYVCSEMNKGLAQVSMEFSIPVAFGVLTVDTIDQAIERAGTKAGNKGAEAALSALEMINVLSEIDS